MSVTLAPAGAPANAPRPNWHVAGAAAVVALLDSSQPSYAGGLEPEDVPAALRRVMRALNVASERAGGLCEPHQAGRVSWGGCTDEQARRRLGEALDVLRYAAEHATGVWWG